VGRKRRDQDGVHRGWSLRRLFAWRVDRQPSAQVPLATAPDAMLREGTMSGEGRPSGVMPGVYCSRCNRPNPDGARYCSNCGAQLMRAETGGWGSGAERPGETTSMISPIGGEPDYADELSPDYSAVDSLPPGTALLVVLRGPNAGSRFLLDDDFTSTGRHPDSDIFLDDVTVSRRHAEFYRTGDRFTVRDVGSLNGTYVNRERIEEAELFGGDEVQIGKFRLLFLTRSPEVGRRRGPGAQDYA
jgi:FHA domain/zinc-ribbon domain